MSRHSYTLKYLKVDLKRNSGVWFNDTFLNFRLRSDKQYTEYTVHRIYSTQDYSTHDIQVHRIDSAQDIQVHSITVYRIYSTQDYSTHDIQVRRLYSAQDIKYTGFKVHIE